MTGETGGKLAVWTPELTSVNGQNIVTRRVVNAQAARLGTVYAYRSNSLPEISKTLWQAMRLAVSVISGQHAGAYVVCSRSSVGFLRDMLPLLTSRVGARVVAHVHGSDFPDLLKRRGVGPLARWLYASCEVIVPSSHLLEPLAAFQFQRLTLCENFAEGGGDAARSEQNSGLAPLVVLWNSNIMASKGIAELVEGVRLLRGEGAAIRLVLLGRPIGDSERPEAEMRAYLDGLRGEEWIEVKGVVPPGAVPECISESDVVALPSEYSSECQPLAVIQGMLAGRTVLVSDTAAMRATVGDYPAIFVERNPGAICEALRPLVVSRIRPSSDAAARARDRFSPERFDHCMRYALAPPD